MNRLLTEEENELVRWLLEHGNATGKSHIDSVENLKVIAHCPCGCASIDFSVDDKLPTDSRMDIVSDYWWTSPSGARNGIFVFLKGGQLAGLEVWSCDGAETPGLPSVAMLRSYDQIRDEDGPESAA